jgi:hypothetical protein
MKEAIEQFSYPPPGLRLTQWNLLEDRQVHETDRGEGPGLISFSASRWLACGFAGEFRGTRWQSAYLIRANGLGRASQFVDGYPIDAQLAARVPDHSVGRVLTREEARRLFKIIKYGPRK